MAYSGGQDIIASRVASNYEGYSKPHVIEKKYNPLAASYASR
jgi:hypothetical protein